MNRVELLAPAGNFDCLKAAINNGANAVYLGGKNFSARAFANNFDEEEIIKAVEYAHLRNVKIYVTVNTLLSENAFNNAIKMVDFYYRNNVDALLIQDLGFYYYIKKNYPDFEIHCSTQMHVHNIEGIKTAKKLGFKRVVIARESDLDFIKEACKQDIEIETFVHGAICVSYSGQCLMSSVTKNRSANKGMCAQCCRLQYDLYKDDTKINTDTKYLISPKDMCLINDIPKLIEAGVSSFKIEGRLKSSAYVGYVTRLYRKAIDSYYSNTKYEISEDELNNLKVLFNRYFTDDYLYKKKELFGQNTPNHLGIRIGNAFKYENGHVFIKLEKQLNQFDGIRINDFGCIVNMLYKDGLLTNKGVTGDIISIKTDAMYTGIVYKTLDYELENSINSTPDLKLPLNINVEVLASKPVKVDIEYFNIKYSYISDIVVQQAIKSPLTIDSIINQFSKLNETEYYINKISVNTDNAFLPIKDLNSIRRQAIANFNEYRLSLFKRETIPSLIDFVNPSYEEEGNISVQDDICKYNGIDYAINYVINSDSIYSDSSNQVICEMGGLLNRSNKIAYYTLNCSNSYCYEFFKRIGFGPIILSTELSTNEINDLSRAFYNRNGITIKPYVLSQGNRVLMYIKANPFDKYIKEYSNIYLNDLNSRYIVDKRHNITEITENKQPNNNKLLFTIYNLD